MFRFVQTPTESLDQNSDNQTSLTPNIEGLKLSDSEPAKVRYFIS